MLSPDRAIELILSDSQALAEAAALNMTLAIPSCPGWHMVDLIVHLGAVQRAQENIISSNVQEPSGIKRDMFDMVPGLLPWLESSVLFGGESNLQNIPNDVVPWFLSGAELLASTLSRAEPDQRVWSWSADQSVKHYMRMLPIEAAIHRWDGQSAIAYGEALPEDLALDCIVHTFDLMVPGRRTMRQYRQGQGELFGFRAVDVKRDWLLEFQGTDVRVIDGASGAANLTIEGTGSELALFLWQRLPIDQLNVSGDSQLVDRYWELVPPA